MTPVLSPDEWRQVAQSFESAVELNPELRADFLDRSCPGDPRIRAEVERMLAADQDAESFLERDPLPEWTRSSFLPEPGILVGAYRLVRELGTGGMGAVWLAERADGSFSRQVAIKFSRAGLISAGAERRLRSERRILAQLQHPHIARLLDGGAVGPGVPYFVMEYVDGRPLLDYAREHNVSPRDRLRLFIDVCQAVHFAHQRLIVHRDLKPANILVDSGGRVRLLDFGVAKLLEANEESGEGTATLATFCTPAYASPEQMRCETVTTASDVFSLGRVLLELLTGERAPGGTSEHPPLDRELASIVRFALQPEPEQRYPSARGLAEDVSRYLEGLPVSARPDTLSYRLTRFGARHRALTAILALLVGLLVFQWVEMRRARQNAQHHLENLRRLALHRLLDYHDKVARLPGSTALREQIAGDSLAYLGGLDAEIDSGEAAPGLSLEISAAWIRLGDAQGRPWAANRGDTAAALRSYRHAEQWARRAGSPRLQLGTALQRQGQVEARQHEWTSALSHLRAAKSLLEHAASDEERLQSVSAVSALGDALIRSGSPEGLRYHHEALSLAEAMGPELRQGAAWRRLTGVIHQRLGNYLASHGALREAMAHQEAALALFEAEWRRHPDDPGVQRDYADQLVMKAEAQARAGDRTGAVADCDRGIVIFERLLRLDSANVEAQRDLGYAWFARVAAASIGGPLDCPGTRKALIIFDALIRSGSAIQEDQDSAKNLRHRLVFCTGAP